MKKYWKYLAIGGGALALIVVLIAVLSQPSPDLSGKYELILEGKLTGTVVDITSSNDGFDVKFLDNEKLRSEYLLPKPRSNRFTIEKTADGQPGIKFDLEVTDGGLKGKADIPALAKNVEVYFRKVPQ
jgi:hypothetical protein